MSLPWRPQRKYWMGAPLVALLTLAAPLAAEEEPAPQWTTSVQTGFADTFQLTLGGTFGGGPAWQNKVTTGAANLFLPSDSLSVYGWDTFDTPGHVNNWQAGVGYKLAVLKGRGQTLSLGSGLQYWQFPSVKTGTIDWLVPGNLIYQARLSKKFSFVATSDSWTLLHSRLPLGSLLHTQTWLQYRLYKGERMQISLKHGPAHTYSWNFYGTNGNRVFRYQAMLAITFKGASIEGGYRKQWGLQTGIRDNEYWQFALIRSFEHGWLWR